MERRTLLSANLVTKLIEPNAFALDKAAMLTIQYSNTGDAAMPAPVLVLSAEENGNQGALLTLDSTLKGESLDTSLDPIGYGQSVDILASGSSPGLLQPGETESINVYYAGWLTSTWDVSGPQPTFTLEALTTDDTQTINWAAMESSLRPAGLPNAAWNAVFDNLTSQLGATWGSFVQELDQDASYLGSIGESVSDFAPLWSLEIERADGINPVEDLATATDMTVQTPGLPLSITRDFSSTLIGRNIEGPFGDGWALAGPWGETLAAQADGSVLIANPDGSEQLFTPGASGSYESRPGDVETLKSVVTQPGVTEFSLTEPDGQSTLFTDGLPSSVQDSDGNQITATYQETNHNGVSMPVAPLMGLTDSNGQDIDLTYNSAGHIARLTNSLGQTTTYTYSANGQELLTATQYQSAEDMVGYTTSYTYSTSSMPQLANLLTSTTDPDGAERLISYDGEGRLSAIAANGGADRITYTYGIGGTVAVADAVGDTTTYSFDERGLVAKLTDPNGGTTLYTYDQDDNPTQVTDQAGQTFSYQYNTQDQMVQSTDPLGNVTRYSHGSLDTLTSLTDPDGNTTQYQYNDNGDLTSTIYTDGTIEKNAFNPIGEITQSTDGNGVVENETYNSAGQVLSETYSDGTQSTFAYDSSGNLVSAVTSSGTTTLTYDTANRLTEIQYPDNTFLKYTYDAAGQRLTMTDQTGYSVDYSYEAAGQLAGLSDASGPIVSYTYDAVGRLVEAVKGNGTYTKYSYDANGDTLSLINFAPNGTINSSFSYTYNDLGLCATETTIDGEWVYTYDAIGQLTGGVFTPNASDPDGLGPQDLQYVYDAAGNRDESVANGVATSYVVNDRNQYTSSTTVGVGTTSFAYDGNGNLISEMAPGGTTTYTYNANNRLSALQGPGGDDSTYQYDAFENLYQTDQDGLQTESSVDPISGDLVGQFTTSGDTVEQYSYGLGLVGQVNSAGAHDYYDFDDLGSTAGLTNSAGTSANRYEYLPFGESLGSVATVANPFQYVGQLGVMTASDGIDLMKFRAMNTSTGTFITPDPLGIEQPTLYTYAKSDPVQLADPEGLWAVTLSVSIHLGVGGSVGITVGSDGIAISQGSGYGLDAGVSASYSSSFPSVGTSGQWNGGVGPLVASGPLDAPASPYGPQGPGIPDTAGYGVGLDVGYSEDTVSTDSTNWSNLYNYFFDGTPEPSPVSAPDSSLDDLPGTDYPITPEEFVAGLGPGTTDTTSTYADDGATTGSDAASYDDNGNLVYSSETSYTYNADGSLATIDTSSGIGDASTFSSDVSAFSYNADGSVSTIDNAFNEGGVADGTLDIDYSYANGTLSIASEIGDDATGQEVADTTFDYNPSGEVTGIQTENFNDGSPDGSITYTFAFNGDGAVTNTVQSNDNASGSLTGATDDSFTYNGDGTVATSAVTQENSNDSPTSSTDSTYSYSDSGQLIGDDAKSYNGSGTLTSSDDSTYTYNSDGQQLSGDSTFFNASGGVVSSTDESFTYNDDNEETNNTVTSYNATGTVTYTSDYTFAYDSEGQLTEADSSSFDSSGASTGSSESSWTYSDGGVLTSTESSTHDASGGLTSENSSEYDPFGQLTDSVSNSYDSMGNLTGSTGETYTYNADGDLTRSETTDDNADGNPLSTSITTYDADGTPSFVAVTDFGPDGSVEASNDSTYTFNSDGVVTGYSVTFFDAAGSPTATDEYSVMGGDTTLDLSTVYEYNSSGSPSGSYSYSGTYGADGDLASLSTTFYSSDDVKTATNLTDFNEDGTVASQDVVSYDAGVVSSSFEETYTYGDGNVTSSTTDDYNASGSLTGSYQEAYDYSDGVVVQETTEAFNASGTLEITFTNEYPDGELTTSTATYPDGETITYSYNSDGDPTGPPVIFDPPPDDPPSEDPPESNGGDDGGDDGGGDDGGDFGDFGDFGDESLSSVRHADFRISSAGSSQTSPSVDLALAGFTFLANEGATFVVDTATFTAASGNISDFSAQVAWGDGTVSLGTISPDSGGGFSVSGDHAYATAGRYEIETTVTDLATGNLSSTFSTAEIVPSLATSEVTVSSSRLQVGATSTVTLTARDAAGDQEPTGGLEVSFSLGTNAGATGTFGPVTDNGNGTYSATFSASSAGSNTITATIFGQAISSSSAMIVVFTPEVPTVFISDAGGTYTGSPFPATATVAGVNGSPASSLEGVSPIVTYFSGTFTTALQVAGLSPLAGAPSQAGAYTALATFAGSADYSGASSLVDFTIAVATPTLVVSDAGGTETGNPFPAMATVAGISGSPASSLEGVSPIVTYYSGTFTTALQVAGLLPLAGAPSQAGAYTALATFAGSADYSGASSLVDFTISPSVNEMERSNFFNDGRDDFGVYGYQRFIIAEPATGQVIEKAFGGPEDVPVVGDFFGDGHDDFGVQGYQRYIVYNPATGQTLTQAFGGPEDVPVVGDFFGDNRDDFAVFGYQRFIIVDPGTGQTVVQPLGGPEDVPVVGDFFGNGHDDLGVYGYGRFLILDPATGKTIEQSFGGPADVPVVGDFFGNGHDDLGVYGYGRFIAFDPATGQTITQAFGGPDDIPVIGDFFGNNHDDFGVFGYDRFIVVDPSTHQTLTQAFGGPDDVPSAESAATILHAGMVQTESISIAPQADPTLQVQAMIAIGSTDPTLRDDTQVSPAGSTPAGPLSRSIPGAARPRPASAHDALLKTPRDRPAHGEVRKIGSRVTPVIHRPKSLLEDSERQSGR